MKDGKGVLIQVNLTTDRLDDGENTQLVVLLQKFVDIHQGVDG